MDHYPPYIIYRNSYPDTLKSVAKPPEYLHARGTFPFDESRRKYLCVIGARDHSPYGRMACEMLVRGLAGYPITIVSGLALGIDSIAHETAIETGLHTISFPGSGLDEEVLYPATRFGLAKKILAAGGALLSPFEHGQVGTRWTFPVRNQIMAALSHATLIIEGAPGSGTLLTARYTLECGRDVLVVPGSIFSKLSYGPHSLMHDGAQSVTCSEEILEALGFDIQTKQHIVENQKMFSEEKPQQASHDQFTSKILALIRGGKCTSDQLILEMKTSPEKVTGKLVEMELQGLVTIDQNGHIEATPYLPTPTIPCNTNAT